MIFKRYYFVFVAVCRFDFARRQNAYRFMNRKYRYSNMHANGSCLNVILNLCCCIRIKVYTKISSSTSLTVPGT